MLDTPVLFLIYRRPDTTLQVFNQIRKAQPRQLFVVADGPKPDRPEETELCRQARAIIDQVDWDCEVKTNYSDVNLGCRERVSSGITWFFEHVEEGIILEDDTVPDVYLFEFCEKLLSMYRGTDVFHINGTGLQEWQHKNRLPGIVKHRYALPWGWATWKDKWFFYSDVYTLDKKIERRINLKNITDSHLEFSYWIQVLQAVENGFDSWFFNWQLSIWDRDGKVVSPEANLTSNIGFSENATNTRNSSDQLREHNIQINGSIDLSITDESEIYNKALFDKFFKGRGFYYREKYWKRIVVKLFNCLKV